MANSGFASSQPLSCDFLPDQAREDLAFGLFGRRPGWPHQAPFRRRSARTFAGFRSPATSAVTRPGLACHRRLAVRCQLLLVRRTRRRARRGGHRRHGKGVRCRRGSLYGAARRLGCWASDRRWAPVADARSCGPRCGAHCSRAARLPDGCRSENPSTAGLQRANGRFPG